MNLAIVIAIIVLTSSLIGLALVSGVFDNNSGDNSTTPTIPPPTIPIPTPPPTIPIPTPPPTIPPTIPPSPVEVFCTKEFPFCGRNGQCLKPGCDVYMGAEAYTSCDPPAINYKWVQPNDKISGNYLLGFNNYNYGSCTSDDDCGENQKCTIDNTGDNVCARACTGDYGSNGPNPCPGPYPQCNNNVNCTIDCGGASGTFDQCDDENFNTSWVKKDTIVTPEMANWAYSPGGMYCTKDYSST